MESIVTKALTKHFKKFIKDFQADQFSVSLLKGTARLTDLELDEAFIQNVMMIPPNTEIRSCTCNELTVEIPGVTKIGEKPVVLTLDKVSLYLEEPEEIKPLPVPQSKKKKSGLSSSPMNATRKGLSNVIRDMKVIIREAHFFVKLRPRDEPGETSPWAPHLRFDLLDIQIVSTNGEWNADVKLSKSVVRDSKEKTETAYKLALCRSLSVALISDTDESKALQIVDRLPVEIHVTTTTSTASKETLGVELLCILDELHFSYTQLSWGLVVRLFSSLRFCLEREIPREIKEESLATIKKRKKKVSGVLDNMEMKYRLNIRKWSIRFLEGLEDAQADNGYLFEGANVHFDVTPKRRVAAESGPSALFESNLNLCLDSVSFGPVKPNPLIQEHVRKVFSQRQDDQDSKFVNVAITHQWARLNEPKSTKLKIDVSGLQLVLDREVLKGFYKFLSSDIITIAKQDQERLRQEKMVRKQIQSITEAEAQASPKVAEKVEKVEELISKIKPPSMSDYFYWFNSSDVQIHITNTTTIIPKDYYVRQDGIQLHRELRATAQSISFLNLADWEIVPRLVQSLESLSTPSELAAFAKDDRIKSNKFQLDISEVCLDSVEPESGTSYAVLKPSTMKVYGRFPEKAKDQPLQPDMELAIHATEFEMTVTEEQEAYLREMIPMYQRWYHKLDKEIKSVSDQTKQELKAKLKKGRKTALSVASKLAEKNQTAVQLMEKSKTNRAQAVEDAIKLFQCSMVFHADQGSLRVPLHNINLDAPSEEGADSPAESAIVPATTSGENVLSQFNFRNLCFVLENTLHHQKVQVELGSFEAHDLDHPKSPSSLNLLPLQGANDFLEGGHSAFVMSCAREHPEQGKAFTNVSVFLQGMQIACQAKKSAIRGIHRELEAAIPDLKRIGQKITDTLVGLKQDQQKVDKLEADVDKMKQRMGKGVDLAERALDFLDLSWSFNLSDCQLVLLENDWTPENGKKPFGSISISSFNKEELSKRFEDLNQELIATKLRLAQSDMGMDNIAIAKKAQDTAVLAMKKQLDEERARHKEELESIEQQLIMAKMSLAEAQVEVQDLQARLKKKR